MNQNHLQFPMTKHQKGKVRNINSNKKTNNKQDQEEQSLNQIDLKTENQEKKNIVLYSIYSKVGRDIVL